MMRSSEVPGMIMEVNVENLYDIKSDNKDSDLNITPETWQKWFQTWGEILVSSLPASSNYELSLRLTGDGEIQSLNSQYRQKEQPTDVLAFAALEVNFPIPDDETSWQEPLYLGDIVISVETANRQAQQHNHSLTQEIAWLAAHGFLHLLGWDHPDDKTLQEMLQQQETLLEIVGLEGQYGHMICSN